MIFYCLLVHAAGFVADLLVLANLADKESQVGKIVARLVPCSVRPLYANSFCAVYTLLWLVWLVAAHLWSYMPLAQVCETEAANSLSALIIALWAINLAICLFYWGHAIFARK